jgi:hypothetical protein
VCTQPSLPVRLIPLSTVYKGRVYLTGELTLSPIIVFARFDDSAVHVPFALALIRFGLCGPSL